MRDDLWPEGGFFDKISDLRDERGVEEYHIRGNQPKSSSRGYNLEDRLNQARHVLINRSEENYGWDDELQYILYQLLNTDTPEDQQEQLVSLAASCAAWYTQIQNEEDNT